MEAYEQMIKDTRRWLGEVDKFTSEVTRQQLARLETSERILQHIRQQIETDTHNETYQRVCITFQDNIFLTTRTAMMSKEMNNMRQRESDFPEILQPKHEEIKGYLRKLEGKIGEIDLVINEIEEKFKRRNYKLTEEERIVVEMLLMDVDAKSRQAKIYSEVAHKTLKSLNSDVESYKRKQGVSGWTVFRWGAAGAGLGALGAAFFLPVLAPVVAGAAGGGVLASVGRYLYGPDLNSGEYTKLEVELNKLESRLNPLKTELDTKRESIDNLKRQYEKITALLFGASVGLAVSGLVLCLQLKRWYATRNFCNRLCSIIQNYSDEVNEMKPLLNQSRWM